MFVGLNKNFAFSSKSLEWSFNDTQTNKIFLSFSSLLPLFYLSFSLSLILIYLTKHYLKKKNKIHNSDKANKLSSTKELASSTNKETVIINVSDCRQEGNKIDQLNTNLSKNSNNTTSSTSNIGTSSSAASTKDATNVHSNTLTTGGSFRSKGHAKSASMSCAGRNETNLTKNNVQNQSNNAELNTNNLIPTNTTETDRPRYCKIRWEMNFYLHAFHLMLLILYLYFFNLFLLITFFTNFI